MNDLSKVKEINVVGDMAYANKHLANGWILITVNSVSGGSNSSVSTEFVLGWEGSLPSKKVSQYEDDVAPSKYAPQYEDDKVVKMESTKPKHKPITIID